MHVATLTPLPVAALLPEGPAAAGPSGRRDGSHGACSRLHGTRTEARLDSLVPDGENQQ